MVKLQDLVNEREATKNDLDIVEAQIAGNAIAPLDELMVNQLLTMTEESKSKLQEVQKKIQHIHPAPADLNIHIAEYKRLFTLAMQFHSQLHGIKMRLPILIVAPPPVVPGAAPIAPPQNIRLPRLELPKFSGHIQDWLSFRDMFDTAVHANNQLSKVQKFTYLKSLVQGDAARQLQSMLISDVNYDIAWANLNERYNNDRELMFAIIRRIVAHPSMQQQSSSSLRTLIDTSKECRRSLAVLNIPVDKGMDVFFLFHIFSKLDQVTREHWEQSLKNSNIPSLDDLFEFLEQRARAVAAGHIVRQSKPQLREEPARKNAHAHHTQTSNCKVCLTASHPLFKCTKFNSLAVSDRFDIAKRNNLCINCFAGNHPTHKCPSTYRCRHCQKRHHTLLHKDEPAAAVLPSPQSTGSEQQSLPPALILHSMPSFTSLLATAVVNINNSQQVQHSCRALLDGGATVSFITEDCCRRLRLRKSPVEAEITGLSTTTVGSSKWSVTITVRPYFQQLPVYRITALVLPVITGLLPSAPFNNSSMDHLNGLTLADPSYNSPSQVDLLFGSDIFWDSLIGGKLTGQPHQPSAFQTSFGWIVAGKSSRPSTSIQAFITNADLHKQLQIFWKLEDLPNEKSLTQEEADCEQFFQATHSRGSDGRFTVSIPKRTPNLTIGSTYDIALRRFHQLERRLPKTPDYHQDYLKFMRDYETLGHMEQVPANECTTPQYETSFIPHHFVLKLDSTSTKFRVVFDASCRSSSGISLNDTMLVGPTLQDSITDIITRFRCHKYAFTADIQKMYRQIRLRREDQDLHRILWRESPTLPLKQFRLLTVTYGTASAPYLATKCLQQLAKDEESTLPLASKAAINDFYVDDLLTGASELEEACQLQDQLLELTKRGGFPLRKFSSNNKSLLDRIPSEFCEIKSTNSEQALPTSDGNPKTLGLIWDVTGDTFKFKVQPAPELSNCNTKRHVLSTTAKLYDPLGWISPIIIKPKILMQEIWKSSIDWDDQLPTSLLEEWNLFLQNTASISKISIPRCFFPDTPKHIRLAGFSDASVKAYAAVIYICAYYESSPAVISLVSSKTRVAPVKQISIPRLELCGAQLLATLMDSTQKGFKITFDSIRCWTDSTIVLSWISSSPTRWKTFVANRVSDIQTILPQAQWAHVPGIDNPADCASRGTTPMELLHHPLWWRGPSLLENFSNEFSPNFIYDDAANEEEKNLTFLNILSTVPEGTTTLLKSFSSLSRLQRLTAWIKRFKYNCLNVSNKRRGPLSVLELKSSLLTWIGLVQQQSFPAELIHLQNKEPVPKSSSIVSLNPFLDDLGLIRVGGRLRKSLLPESQKHPLVLPSNSHLTQLLIHEAHITHLHAGPQLVQAALFQQYWILRARDSIRNAVKRCITCRRNAPVLQQQQMADLPIPRVTQARPFLRCGVDYAGPFSLKPIPVRSKSTFKAYIALFICLSTRAIHLEVVSSLSTECFIAALRRFCSRRGRPSDMYSDQGTNFVGANKELKQLLSQSTNYNDVAINLSKDGIQWHFNPPSAPHFGGLWEAGVKSVKFHLRRVVGSTILNLEEMTTVCCQVEAVLNSRPLTAQSSDPSDLSVLTPGHFLIGCPITAVPDPDLKELKLGRLGRWQLLQRMTQDFWRRWSKEFLTRLQQRPKWHQSRSNLKLDDLVIIKDDNLPPQQWKLARIIQLHPGDDNCVRVVTLKTAEGVLKRPVHKLSLLPVHD